MIQQKKRFRINKKITPYLLLLPAFLYYAFFWMYPVMIGLFESFTDTNNHLTISNYTMLFTEIQFDEAIINTALFVLFSIFLQYIVGLAMAFLLNKRFKGSKIVLFIILIPMAITPTAVAILWKTALSTTGWLNNLLVYFELIAEPIVFLDFQGTGLILLLVAIDTWTVLPSVIIIMLAGLQNMNKELKEAGYVFGATKWQVIKDIIIPILKPSIITSIILRMIAAIQIWSLSVMLLGFNRMPFMVERIAYYIERMNGVEGSVKTAYAMSMVVAAIVFVTTMIYYKIAKKTSILEAES